MKKSSKNYTMMRSYGQYCGLARALDVVGDRWNLLIVRQLLLGPARYAQLLQGLPGVATNLLTDRLRALEGAGIVERRLADRSNAIVYALTPWGAELREPVEALIRWSTPLMLRGPEGDGFCPEWLVVALRALLAGKVAKRSATIGIDVDNERISLRLTPTGIDVHRHEAEEQYDAVLRAEPSVILGLAAGMLTLEDVAERIEVDGDKRALRVAFDLRSVTPGPKPLERRLR